MQSQPISSNTPNNVATRFHNLQNVSRTTMSTREIAQLTGKSHDSVLRDARILVAGGVLKTEETPYTHPQNGQAYPEFLLSERDCLVLVSGYDAQLRAKIVDRWLELEAKPAFNYAAAFSDPRTLLALLTENVTKVVALEADNSELSHENLMLEQKVAADAPKVGFFDAVTVTHETYSVAEATKLIGTGQNRLMAFLRQRRWVTLRKNEPMQAPIESGYLTAKLSTFEHPENGTTPVSTPRVTGKGLTKLRALWAARDADLLGGAR
ncbi:phage regulatory protein/antirepressor Ant [Pseudomonas sp. 6D_7.1_Bac1]|uniref:phage regulatory protein/antirepressor Ant n=1 Tax=Pseudomonas sp. 6D_7.1_Bac1 TaxID=2971615 RepID=UPI0021C6F153|nr:phage regulatory protein/antirepressor Ant [Pseudomonas sp. 6D_7.1_Bac1]MCU1752173.1 phage regulatory protein/antirepressor Ant [Pseudomonas sp. 6D_7.1_Bac1]